MASQNVDPREYDIGELREAYGLVSEAKPTHKCVRCDKGVKINDFHMVAPHFCGYCDEITRHRKVQ